MEARVAVRALPFLLALLALAACAGHKKGVDAGIGIDAMDTISEQQKENDAWFKSFYGKNHCHGQWAGDCSAGDEESSGAGGWMGWGDSGSSE